MAVGTADLQLTRLHHVATAEKVILRMTAENASASIRVLRLVDFDFRNQVLHEVCCCFGTSTDVLDVGIGHVTIGDEQRMVFLHDDNSSMRE